MKNFRSTIASLVIAATFATVISCSEQDEVPAVNPTAKSQTSNGLAGKTRTSGRVGGKLFNSAVGDPIDPMIAKSWAANYRAKNPDDIKGHFFGFEIINQILNQNGCIGIRMYYGLDGNGKKVIMLVGVDSEGENIISTSEEFLDGEEGIIADASWPCPDYCPEEDL